MSEVLQIDPNVLLERICPLTPHQTLHMLDSMTWFPTGENERWTRIAQYVSERTVEEPQQSTDTYRGVYGRLIESFALDSAPASPSIGRWADIPAPKRLYQLKYAIKALMLPDRWFNCMNMGFADQSRPAGWITPPPGREIMRWSLQLYDRVAQGAELTGRKVLEVGSGRGGGAIFLAERYNPASYTGLELCDMNVQFSRQGHGAERVRFLQGDAEAIPFADGVMDVLINIESAHCYPHVAHFFAEAYRVLQPGGRLLFSDEWWLTTAEELRGYIAAAGFQVVKEENITTNIILALDQLEAEYPAFLDRCADADTRAMWQRFFCERVCRDSGESYRSGRFGFFNFVLEKPEA